MMACFDFSTGMAWVMGSFPIPATDIDGNDTNILGANGNDALCKAQGELLSTICLVNSFFLNANAMEFKDFLSC